MLKKVIAFVVASHFIALPNFVQAQSSDFNRTPLNEGVEARLSFTIPLGDRQYSKKMAPRLGLVVRNYQHSSKASTDWVLADSHSYQEIRLGLTLQDTPNFMVNDQFLKLNEGEQANVSTAGKIGLGVVAVALVGVAVIAVALAECEDDPGGCFGDE